MYWSCFFCVVFWHFPVTPSVLARVFLFIAWLYTLRCSDFAIVVFPTLINPFPHDLVLSKAHPACEFQMLLWNYLLKFCSCYSVQLSWSFLVLHFNLTRLFCYLKPLRAGTKWAFWWVWVSCGPLHIMYYRNCVGWIFCFSNRFSD